MVVIVSSKTLDEVHSEIPLHLRTGKHSEVGTIMWIEWASARRSGLASGYYPLCVVRVIDKATNKIIDEYVGEQMSGNRRRNEGRDKAKRTHAHQKHF